MAVINTQIIVEKKSENGSPWLFAHIVNNYFHLGWVPFNSVEFINEVDPTPLPPLPTSPSAITPGTPGTPGHPSQGSAPLAAPPPPTQTIEAMIKEATIASTNIVNKDKVILTLNITGKQYTIPMTIISINNISKLIILKADNNELIEYIVKNVNGKTVIQFANHEHVVSSISLGLKATDGAAPASGGRPKRIGRLPYEDRRLNDLKALAQGRGIKHKGLKKAELIARLRS